MAAVSALAADDHAIGLNKNHVKPSLLPHNITTFMNPLPSSLGTEKLIRWFCCSVQKAIRSIDEYSIGAGKAGPVCTLMPSQHALLILEMPLQGR